MKIEFSIDDINRELNQNAKELGDVVTLKSSDKFFVAGGCEHPSYKDKNSPKYISNTIEHVTKNVAICNDYMVQSR